MYYIKQNESTSGRRRISVLLVDQTDGNTAETGKTPTTTEIQISKNGAATSNPASIGSNWGEVGRGIYYFELASGDVDTLGYVTVNVRISGCRDFNAMIHITAYDAYSATNLGLSSLPTANVNDSGGLITNGSSTGQLSVSGGRANADIKYIDGAALNTANAQIGVNVVSMASGAVASIWNALTSGLTTAGSIGKRIADNLDVVVSTRSTLTAANVWDYLTSAATTAGSIGKRIADNLDALISSRSTITTAQVNAEVDTALSDVGLSSTVTSRIDVAVSTRLADASYTTPPTAGAIADAVWDEPTNQHTTGNTFGKDIDLIKKANYVTESQVTSDITPTTTTFSVALVKPTGYFDEQAMIFTTGTLTGEAKAILSWTDNTTYSTIVLQEPLSAAPVAGAEFVITSQQVHAKEEIAETIWNEVRATSSPSGGIPAIGTYGYYLDSRVSTAGGQGGGSSTLVTGPFALKSEQGGSDDVIDILVGSSGEFIFHAVNENGQNVGMSATNTNALKIYNSAGTLVENSAVTVKYAEGGIISSEITTTTTANSGTYDAILEVIDAASNVVKFGPIKVKVRAL